MKQSIKQILKGMYGNIKHTSIYNIEALKKDKREWCRKNIWGNNSKNFPKGSEKHWFIDPWRSRNVKQGKYNQSINQSLYPGTSWSNCSNPKIKRKSVKASKEIQHTRNKGSNYTDGGGLPTRNNEGEKDNRMLKGIKSQTRIPQPVKWSLKYTGKMKTLQVNKN